MRDVTLEDTFYHDFTTRQFSDGVPTVFAGSPVLSVLEENNATPITAGVSVSVDRASVAGLNMATIVATAANGYENGKGYSIYVSTGTVGGVSAVGEVVGQFTIGASAAAVDLANGTDGLGAIKAETALIVGDTAGIAGAAMRGTDSAGTAANLATVDTVVDAILVDTTGLNGDAMRGTDSASTHSAAAVARLVLPQVNTAFSDIVFPMYDSTNHNLSTGLTVTGTRSLNGGAFAAVTGTIAEIGSGIYQLDGTDADMNGAMIIFLFSAAASDDTPYIWKTTP